MPFCKNCNYFLLDSETSCPKCGTPINAPTGKAAKPKKEKRSKKGASPSGKPEMPSNGYTPSGFNGYPPPSPGPQRPGYTAAPPPPGPQRPQYGGGYPPQGGQQGYMGAGYNPGYSQGYAGGKPPKKKKKWGCLITILILLLLISLPFIIFFAMHRTKSDHPVVDEQRPPFEEYVESDSVGELAESLPENAPPAPHEITWDDEGQKQGYVNNIVLVTFFADTSDAEILRVAGLADGTPVGCIRSLNQYQIAVPPQSKEALRALCDTLSAEPSVIMAIIDKVSVEEENFVDPSLEEVIPNDPWGSWFIFSEHWSMIAPGGKNWHLEATGVPSAWAYEDYFHDFNVGVVDNGFDTGHDDLSSGNVQVINPDTNTAQDHGTHVLGIMAATKDNDTGVTGIFDDAHYYAYGTTGTTTVDNQVIYSDLLNRGCQVITRSQGMNWWATNDSPSNHTDAEWHAEGVDSAKIIGQLIYQYGNDFILFQSAGNDGQSAYYNTWLCTITETTAEEAAADLRASGVDITGQQIMDSIMVIANVENSGEGLFGNFDKSYQLSESSNFGNQISICAPGDDIYSTIPNNRYAKKSGTSMSTPFAAAVTAMVWSIDPSMSAGTVKNFIIENSRIEVSPNPNHSDDTGTYYMIDAKNCVEQLLLQRGSITETRPDGDILETIFWMADKEVAKIENDFWREVYSLFVLLLRLIVELIIAFGII